MCGTTGGLARFSGNGFRLDDEIGGAVVKIQVDLIDGIGSAIGVFAQPRAINAAQIFAVVLFF